MKKIILLLICLIFLTGCQDNDADLKLYNEMLVMLSDAKDYKNSSKYFSVSYEVANTNDGNRYYIVIDNPTIAMFDVKVIAFEEGLDTENVFAPNAGIFDESINLVPNQINKDQGYVKGISISGISSDENSNIYCLVQWKDEKNTKIYREYLVLSKGQ